MPALAALSVLIANTSSGLADLWQIDLVVLREEESMTSEFDPMSSGRTSDGNNYERYTYRKVLFTCSDLRWRILYGAKATNIRSLVKFDRVCEMHRIRWREQLE